MTTNSDSTVEQPSQGQPKVFLSFRGHDLRYGFISFLQRELTKNNIKYYIDSDEIRGKDVDIILDRIKECQIALVFFSEHYPDSEYCLEELVPILKLRDEKKLIVIPIFFRVKPDDVEQQKAKFGTLLYGIGRLKLLQLQIWQDALTSSSAVMGMVLEEKSSECEFLEKIIMELKRTIEDYLKTSRARELSNMLTCSGESSSATSDHKVRQSPPPLYGMELRLKQLEERLDFDYKATQIVGIVGMSGIGKTTLAQMHFDKWDKKRLNFNKIVLGVRGKPNTDVSWLKTKLLSGTTYNEDGMFKTRMFVVLDDVSKEEQIKYLLDNRHRIQKGSKIVITTRDKSWLQGLVDHTYVVPELSKNEAFQLFTFYTSTQNFSELSKQFVDYAGGNPRALGILGSELDKKDEADWRKQLEELPRSCSEKIRAAFRISYDELTDDQQTAFLDIACFLRSEDEDCVTSLLASKDIRDLTEKFLLRVSAGQIEMPDIMCSLGKDLSLLESAQDKLKTIRLWDQNQVTEALYNGKQEDTRVRGILIDVSKLKDEITIARNKLAFMPNLRYLKIFDSRCPLQCQVVKLKPFDCKVHIPDGLDFPLEEIRYFHWLKFPSKQLPLDFKPKNLIDLRLPYSNIKRVWNAVMDTPNLKWVDLSHSERLIDVSALSKAKSLQRLNLEGCTKLVNLPEDTESLQSLVFLNLRGCTSLSSLPKKMNLKSLKTLILTDCSKLKKFHVISTDLVHLNLDGTGISELPETMEQLRKLIVLNLKDCKMLESLPKCLHKLKALEELILSGCSSLESFPEIKEDMENLQILLLDRTKIEDVPRMLLRCVDSVAQVNKSPHMSGLLWLRRLCLSKNPSITHLDSSIGELHHLKWIDLKYCENLISISTLPSDLHCLDAHECISLTTVTAPLARLPPTEQVPSSFIFTNCEKLEPVAKYEITCYGHNKGRLLSKTLNRHNKGFSFEAFVSTCFPGSEVPTWFGHKASGPVLEPELPLHWTKSGFVGIALCAIVLFEENKIQNSNLQVKCICDFNVNTSSSYFNCPVGGLSETGSEQRTIKSAHVFIGYTNWLNIKTCQEEDGNKCCVLPTKASINFQVTDDIGEVRNCEVLKCGFSLLYESGSSEASSRKEDVKQGELKDLKMKEKIFDSNSGENITSDISEASCSSTTS